MSLAFETGAENPYSVFRLNGETALGWALSAIGANTWRWLKAPSNLPRTSSRHCAGHDDGCRSDDSLFISRAIDGVWLTLAEAACWCAWSFSCFGHWRATIIPRLPFQSAARGPLRCFGARLFDQPADIAGAGARHRLGGRRRIVVSKMSSTASNRENAAGCRRTGHPAGSLCSDLDHDRWSVRSSCL